MLEVRVAIASFSPELIFYCTIVYLVEVVDYVIYYDYDYEGGYVVSLVELILLKVSWRWKLWSFEMRR
jgi:hypothetical protein